MRALSNDSPQISQKEKEAVFRCKLDSLRTAIRCDKTLNLVAHFIRLFFLHATDFCVKQKLIHTPADTELDREAFVTVIVASMKHSSFMRSEGFTGPHYLITRIAGILQAFDVFLNVLFHVVPFL